VMTMMMLVGAQGDTAAVLGPHSKALSGDSATLVSSLPIHHHNTLEGLPRHSSTEHGNNAVVNLRTDHMFDSLWEKVSVTNGIANYLCGVSGAAEMTRFNIYIWRSIF
jgi:hypothetical protein